MLDGLPGVLGDLLGNAWWAKWAWAVFGPLVQEDLAIITTAALATGPRQPTYSLFLAIWFGAVVSDLWKYYIGRWILRHPKARAARNVERIQSLERDVKRRLPSTLLSVRFVPLARIPTYAACGYFGVAYWRYALWITVAAFVYIALAFFVLDMFGTMFLEEYRWVVAVAAGAFLLFSAWRTWRRTHPDRQ